MFAEAKRLAEIARADEDPAAYIGRWLVQEFTPDCCAVAIYALYLLTGKIWGSPLRPEPLYNEAVPHIWLDAAERVRRHNPAPPIYKIGDRYTADTGTLGEQLLNRIAPIEVQPDDLPEAKLVSAADTFTPANGIKRDAVDRDRAAREGKRKPVIVFIPPRKRGEGSHKRFQVT